MSGTSPTPTPLAARQQEPGALRLQLAFRRAYSDAKRWYGLRLSGALVLAAAAPLILFLAPSAGETLGAVAGGWVVLGRTWVTARQRDAVAKAVAIQELFETRVLDLPINAALPAAPAEEEISALVARAKVTADPAWFATAAELNHPADVLAAQRSSSVWTRRLHQAYRQALLGAVAAWAALTVLVGVTENASLAAFLAVVLLPMLPALLDAIELGDEHQRYAHARWRLERRVEDLLDRLAAGQVVAVGDCRAVQDEVHRLRLTAPLIPDRYNGWCRDRYERDMRAAADVLAEKFRRASEGATR